MIRTLCIFFLLGIVPAYGQTVSKSDMKAVLIGINKAYADNKAYSMDVKHSSYAGHESAVPVETQSGKYVKSGLNYYSNLLGIETIQNGEAKLVVAKNERYMLLSDKDKLKNMVVDQDYLNHVLDQAESIKKTALGKQVKYIIKLKSGELESYTITVNENNFITELGIFYRKERQWKNKQGQVTKGKPKLLVSYSNIKLNPSINKERFSFNKYLRVSGKTYKPSSAFVNYNFTDTRLNEQP